MTLFLFTLSVVCLLMGMLVWARQPNRFINQAFAALTFFITLWIITNALFTVIDGEIQYIDALVSYGVAGMVVTLILAFCMALIGKLRYVNLIILIGFLLAITSSLPGVLATGVSSENEVITTPFIMLYGSWIASFLLTGVGILAYGRKQVSQRRKMQIDSIFLGLTLAALGGLVCNMILPLTGNYSLVALGPAFAVLFVWFFGYSIIRRQLFDIRRAIARLIAYAASVAVLGVGLGYVGYMLYQSGVGSYHPLLLFMAIGLSLAVVYPLVKSIFDKIANAMLLSNEFDMQKAIGVMTTLYSSSIQSEDLEKKTSQELRRLMGTSSVWIKYDLDRRFSGESAELLNSLLIRDVLIESDELNDLLEFMESENIAVISPLVIDQNIVGYLCVGDKSNGTGYSSHDLQFLGIISHELAIALQNAERLEKISHFNEELQEKIFNATAKLRESNKKLRDMDEAKDEFISMASHQLRTPLTSIKGYISMLLDGDIGKITVAQRQALEEAYSSSQRMVYLISDFLNLSRLKTGKFIIERGPVVLSKIIAQEISQLKAVAKAKGIELKYQPPSDLPTLHLDETKVRQVMMNFIDNAIYYSKLDGGVVEIKLAKDDKSVRFEVVDNGIGVPDSAREKLFTKFFRADNARKQRPDGTGIGLFMAKKVIVAHGGSIIFESQENAGSTFGFKMPLSDVNLGKKTDNPTDKKN